MIDKLCTSKMYYILMGASVLLSIIASEIDEKVKEKELEKKVDTAIVQACVKVGMLEVDNS